MSNYFTLQLDSNLLLDQAKFYKEHMEQQAKDHSKTQLIIDYAALATQAFNSFMQYLGTPITQPYIMSSIPIADYWNLYQHSVIRDLKVLYNQFHTLDTRAHKNQDVEAVKNRMLSSAINSIYSQIANMQISSDYSSGEATWYVYDTFVDSSKVDLTNTDANISNGNVTIKTHDSTKHNDHVKLFVDDNFIEAAMSLEQHQDRVSTPTLTGISNGFLGNTHEVTIDENTNTSIINTNIYTAIPIVDTNNSTVKFVGDSDLHNDIDVVIDGNSKTWFEYEVVNIPDTVKNNPCQDYGFTMTLGNQGSNTVEIPWYAFHEGEIPTSITDIDTGTEFFPAPPNTTQYSQYGEDVDQLTGNYILSNGSSGNPFTGNSTTTSYVSGNSVLNIGESGANNVGNTLRLGIIGHMKSPKKISHIEVTPYVINGTAPTVKSIEVKGKDESNWLLAQPVALVQNDTELINVQNVVIPSSYVGSPIIWQFSEKEVSQVKIVMEQSQSYNTNVGHIVWSTPIVAPGSLQDNTMSGSVRAIAGNSGLPANVNRVNGPEMSLENLVDAKHKVKDAKKLGGVYSLIPGIENKQTLGVSGPYLEYFSGWRYVIGISNIDFGHLTYAKTSVLQSVSQDVPINIKEISLDVFESIPLEFKANTEYISYEFSVDKGNTWYAIAPATHAISDSPTKYFVNPGSGQDSVPANAGVVTQAGGHSRNNPINSISLRASLKRPGQENLTPYLHMYRLKLVGDIL